MSTKGICRSHRIIGAAVSLVVALATLPPALAAQNAPYRDMQNREIKALSQDQINGLLEGRGMGLALAAELNSYPGPRHLIEFADSIHLTGSQLESVNEIYGRMEEAARSTGNQIVVLEQRLDSLFASGSINQESLAELTREIGIRTGDLRRIHLAAHLEAKELLSDHQVMMYDRLRGYGEGGHDMRQHDMGQHGMGEQ